MAWLGSVPDGGIEPLAARSPGDLATPLMPLPVVVFTICSNNYLPQAEVFFASVRAFHPEVDLVLGLADECDPGLTYPPGVQVIEARELGIVDFESFAFAYDVMEFNTAIKPSVMLRLFEDGYRKILYFDPDIALYRRLDDLLELLETKSFVLTPHFLEPPAPGDVRTEHHVMQTGVYNLGFFGSSQRAETEPCLRWWARMLRYGCVNAQERGLFVDQKYLDLLPGLAADLHVLRDPGFNVAYWNLPRRRLAAVSDGSLAVDGRPLAFFHFSGFDPAEPERLSRYAPDAPVSGVLATLLADYAARRSAAEPPGTARPYAYGAFASGVSIPGLVRRCFRERHATWSGDPFAHYDRYSRLPSPKASLGALGETVTNLMQQHHAATPELRFAFDLEKPFEVSAYARFFARHAAAEGIDPSLWQVAR